MDYRIEVITLPVTDIDRAVRFYTEQVGFTLDVDYRPDSRFRVVQLTPPGSACSIQFSSGLTEAKPDPGRPTYLVVSDIEAAHRELSQRGVPVSPIRHKHPVENWQGDFVPGTDPQRRNYASFLDFTDPDGNAWTIQEIGHNP